MADDDDTPPFRVFRRPIQAGGAVVEALAPEALMALVRELSFPRPISDPAANARAAAIIRRRLEEDGRTVVIPPGYGNVVALPAGNAPITLIGAHFDSVEGTPGADDNASAVAVMLGISRALRACGSTQRVGFIAFNAEEDGISGSAEWADAWATTRDPPIASAHVLEMLGFASSEEGSQQQLPGALAAIEIPTTADFVGVLGNEESKDLAAAILAAAAVATDVPVMALQTYFGLEKLLPDLDLSDHIRLWAHDIPTVLWTDTAFYRNPHYHLDSDTPETLDPQFMSAVAHLLFRSIVG